MKKIAAFTLGCKVNLYDTEAMLSLFEEKGYEIVDFENFADVYIINTCTVTNLSSKKSRQAIRKAKSRNPDSIIAVAGCYAQTSPSDVAKIDGVNIILGTKDRSKALAEIENYTPGKISKCVSEVMKKHEYEPLKISRFSDRQRVFLKVEDGCDNFCAYCIIPYARGAVRSRKLEDVLSEARQIAECGYKEIVLTGIHLASYGKDLINTDLKRLLCQIHGVGGIERIRLSSLEPTIITEDFIKTAKNLHKLCPHFHLSLQSGCDKTLKNMNRKYTTAEYSKAVTRIREAFPLATVTTDMIAGFPGETGDDFIESLNFAENMNFLKIHVFPYSEKKGTKAASMPGKLTKTIKNGRASKLQCLSEKLMQINFERFIGTNMNMLVERQSERSFFGYTENYIPVQLNTDKDIKPNDIIKVKLSGLNSSLMFATLL